MARGTSLRLCRERASHAGGVRVRVETPGPPAFGKEKRSGLLSFVAGPPHSFPREFGLKSEAARRLRDFRT
jgi:hypothetical protein